MNETLYQHLVGSAAEAARVARGVRPAQLSAPTPCTNFDARTLINHWVLYTSHGLEHRARRTPLPEELLGRDFTADADWAEAYAAQLDRAVAAWGDPAAWVGEVDLGGSASPAADLVELLLAELVLHGWDVATATGQHFGCTEETATAVLAVVERFAEMFRKYQGFAAPVALPGPARAFDRALARSGRDPHWSPAGPPS